jgi:hypothetical protein
MKASDDPVWHEDRNEAITLAKEQGKYVFLLYGRTTCGNCNAAKKYISEAPLNEIILENFILWFCDIDIPERRAQASDYREYYSESITLPLLCVINPDDPMPALSYSTDKKNAEEIEAILNANLPTANEDIAIIPNKAYIANNILTISNFNMNEIIHIYTTTGQLLDSFDKKDNTVTRRIYSYPKGILFISSSLGWNLKVINQNGW